MFTFALRCKLLGERVVKVLKIVSDNVKHIEAKTAVVYEKKDKQEIAFSKLPSHYSIFCSFSSPDVPVLEVATTMRWARGMMLPRKVVRKDINPGTTGSLFLSFSLSLTHTHTLTHPHSHNVTANLSYFWCLFSLSLSLSLSLLSLSLSLFLSLSFSLLFFLFLSDALFRSLHGFSFALFSYLSINQSID